MSNEINNPDFTFCSMKGAIAYTWVHLVMFDPMHNQLRETGTVNFFHFHPSLKELVGSMIRPAELAGVGSWRKPQTNGVWMSFIVVNIIWSYLVCTSNKITRLLHYMAIYIYILFVNRKYVQLIILLAHIQLTTLHNYVYFVNNFKYSST